MTEHLTSKKSRFASDFDKSSTDKRTYDHPDSRDYPVVDTDKRTDRKETSDSTGYVTLAWPEYAEKEKGSKLLDYLLITIPSLAIGYLVKIISVSLL